MNLRERHQGSLWWVFCVLEIGWYQCCSIQSSVVSVLGPHRTSKIEFTLLEWIDVGQRRSDQIGCKTHFDGFCDVASTVLRLLWLEAEGCCMLPIKNSKNIKNTEVDFNGHVRVMWGALALPYESPPVL